MDNYFLITMIIIGCSILNLRTTYMQTKDILCNQTIRPVSSPKATSYLFRIKDKTVSKIGKMYFYIIFLPTVVLSVLSIIFMAKSLLMDVNGNYSINHYCAHIFATVIVLLSRISYSFVINVLENNEKLIQEKGIGAVLKLNLSSFRNISIRTWVFAVLCLVPLLFEFNVLSMVICLFSAVLIILTEIKFLTPKRIAGVIFIQICIIVVGCFISFLFTL